MSGLAFLILINSAGAQNKSTQYIFVMGTGFLCASDESSSCLVTAKATQGDSYELSGAGTFDTQNKSVRAAGIFTHKSALGRALETGVWTASELVSFASYGIAPGAWARQKATSGLPRLGPISKPLGLMPVGGLAVFRIELMATSGATRTAILQVNSAVGTVPPERALEGIRLTLRQNAQEYSEEAGGRAMFLATRSPMPDGAQAPEHDSSVESPPPSN